MNEDDLMIFQEASTGKLLVVERTDELAEFNTYLFDKNKELISNKKISTLFEKDVPSADAEFYRACGVAMEMYGINKTDAYVDNLKYIERELENAKSGLQREQGEKERKHSKIDSEHIKQDFKYISEIFESGDSLSIRNNEVGFISVDKGNIGKSGNGLQHIIEQRFEKDGKSVDEISAVLALVLNATEDGKVTRNVEVFQNEKDIGTFDIEKNGIISFVSKTRDGKDEKFVITGFDDFSKKEEAEDAIKAVIADNSYAPEFVIVKNQVVATLASSYILHLDEIKRNYEQRNDKKVKYEIGKLENYEKSSELKDYFLEDKNQKKLQEATESINAVIAQYGDVPEFLGMYAQVGAVIASQNILSQTPEKSNNQENAQNALGFQSFDEIKEQYPNAVDLSNSDKKKWSYKDVTDYLKSIVNDVMVTSDGDKIAISDDYDHIEKSSSFNELNRRGKEEIKTYAAEIKKLTANSEFQKEIENKDSAKVDVEKFKYYTVPVWINNRAYNVILECGQLKNETSDSATRKGVPNDTFTEVSKEKHIRKHGKLQVLDISYLYNIRNRPLENKIEKSKFNNLAKEYNGLLKDYDENIKDYNNLLSSYNKSQEENQKLKNQLQSQNQKKNQGISR